MNLLPLEDVRWESYRDGYKRNGTEVVSWIESLFDGDDDESRWEYLWDELHHQGDLGEAAYAVIPYLAKYVERTDDINWNIFAFAAVVEIERFARDNPAIPLELEESYTWAIAELPRLAVACQVQKWSSEQVMSISACLALSRGQGQLARAYLELSPEEAKLFLQALESDDE